MARPNPENKYGKTPVWQFVLIGILIVLVIVALYYGFFMGEQGEQFEQQEDPATVEQGITGVLSEEK